MPNRAEDELRLSHRYLGQPIDRLDGVEKVTGAARFSAEYPVEGLAQRVDRLQHDREGRDRTH